MKSPTLSSADALNYTLLERSSINVNYQQVYSGTGRRRKSRKNFLIFTVVYIACVAMILMYAF